MSSDVRSAWRRMRRAPFFTVVTMATIALAVGANTAVFTLADALFIRPLPYNEPHRLFVLRMHNVRTGVDSSVVPPQYLQTLTDNLPSGLTLGLRESQAITPHLDGYDSEWVPTVAVHPTYFNVLGVTALRGRVFTQADIEEAGRSAVISYRTWRERFGGDEHVVGRDVVLGKVTRTIIGVLPQGFIFPSRYVASSRLVALGRPQYEYVTVSGAFRRLNFEPIVRLGHGTSREQAEAQLQALWVQANSGKEGVTLPVLVDLRAVVFPTSQSVITALAVAAALILLVGCANVGTLFLARMRTRERDIGIRMALGATRWMVLRAIIAEIAIISCVAGLASLTIAHWTLAGLLRLVPPQVYGDAGVGVDVRVAIFSFALGGLSGLIFAAAPAWGVMGLDLQEILRGSKQRQGRPRNRFPAVMIGWQVAITFLAIFGAAIAGRAALSMLRTPIGLTTDNVIFVTVEPREADQRGFYLRAIQVLSDRADVEAAGAISSLPLTDPGLDDSVVVEGDRTAVGVVNVLPGYFESVGLHALRGRLLTRSDAEPESRVAVMDESAAQRLFSGEDAIGRTFTSHSGGQFVVVGIVSDSVTSLDATRHRPLAYVVPTTDRQLLTLVARLRYRDRESVSEIRREISLLARGAPINVGLWTDAISRMTTVQIPKLQAVVLGVLGGLALTLTALGIFATVTFAVTARSREIATRIALGAPPRSIAWLFVRRTMTAVVAGVAAGVLATWWLGALVDALLSGTSSSDMAALCAGATVIMLVAILAAYLASRRISGIDAAGVFTSE